jgi:hypothetical protein
MKELIDANELRIGNLYNDNGVFKKASPSTIDEVWNAPRSWCKAIPLTEEWLLKFGFEKKYWGNDGNQHPFMQKGLVIIDLLDHTIETASGLVIQIKYVNQLQNLYFALTGEELKQQEQ